VELVEVGVLPMCTILLPSLGREELMGMLLVRLGEDCTKLVANVDEFEEDVDPKDENREL